MIQGEEQLEKMEEQKKEMEQNKEQNKEYFLELKQIYNTPIPKPDVSKQVHNQKFLFYIDLTNSEIYKNSLLQLSINNSIQREWQGGFLGEFQFHNQKKEQQHIFCYYFNKLIENNGNINIQNLFRFRLFLQEFISTQKNYQIKFVFHFKQKNGNQKEFEGQIVKFIYQVLEGSFDKLNDIICVYNNQESQQIKYCQISSKQIYFNNDQWSDEFDISFIKILDEFLEYFQYKQNDPNQIGQICQEYVQEYVNIVLKEFEEELLHLYKDIQLMLQFPVNLNNEKECNINVCQYLIYLESTLKEINKILTEVVDFDQISQKLKKQLGNLRKLVLDQFSEIAKENTYQVVFLKQIQKYQQINSQAQSPNENTLPEQIDILPEEFIKQLLKFQFELLECDIEILQKLKKHNFNQNCINKTLFRMRLDIKLWYEQFDLYLPQSLAYIMRITPHEKAPNFNRPWVFVIGNTRVGKSTLLNILSDPKNIIINEYNRFDVKEKDQRIKVGHGCNSETFEISSLEIDNIIFYDTPGVCDTNQMNRLFNHLNFHQFIKQSKQAILLLMIDGEQLLILKNDLIDSIAAIQQIFGKNRNDKNFENLIIPVFTKLKKDFTMEQIKTKWQSEIMKNIQDTIQLKILDLIYTAINEDNYQKIYQAEFYQIQDQTKQEIQQLQEKANDCFTQNKNEDGQKYLQQMKIKKQKSDELQNKILNSKMVEIKTDLIRKCENILEKKNNSHQQQNPELQLNQKLLNQLDNLQNLLPNGYKFQQHILNIITHDFIAKMLYDETITIEEKFKQICKLIDKKINYFENIPLEFINMNSIRYEIQLLDVFNYQQQSNAQNNCSSQSDKIFQQLQQQLRLLYDAFIAIIPKYKEYNYQLKHGWKESIQLNPKIFQQIPKMIVYTVFCIPVILISGGNDLFWNHPFVSEEEKKKKEKLNLINIQQEYYKQIQNIK